MPSHTLIFPCRREGALSDAFSRRMRQLVQRSGGTAELLAPCGPTLEHAILTGMQEARGDTIVCVDPAGGYSANNLPMFLAHLARADLVVGRRRRTGWSKVWERAARLPRWSLLGLDAHDPGCLFWAARRESVANLPSNVRHVRYWPSMVARRGYRVGELYVEGSSRAFPVEWRACLRWPMDLLCAWQYCRRIQASTVAERGPAKDSRSILRFPNQQAVCEAPISPAQKSA